MTFLARLRKRWPEIRAGLLALHVAAVVILSFPASPKLLDRTRWEDQRTRGEIALWADRLRAWGIDTTAERLEARLWSLMQDYLAARRALGAPFEPYLDVACITQGWGMFRSPQRRPGELSVSIRERDHWRQVYLSRSDEHRYLAKQLDHNRLRKLVSAAIPEADMFDHLAHWIARQAARDFPDASDVVVEILRFDSLPPERLRAGEQPRRQPQRRLRIGLELYR